MTPQQFLELCAQRESDKLDFKKEMYDWGADKKARKAANAELAKDTMAMANLIPAGGPSCFILFGVVERPSDKTGQIVGITRGDHPDDADLQQKVKGILNRVPNFQYHQFEVEDDDGNVVSVGTIEVIGGERPYFPLKDLGTLKRNVAMVRVGTSTDIASPTQIQKWVGQDNPAARELERIELANVKAENTPIPYVREIVPHHVHGEVFVNFTLTNKGTTPFTLERSSLRVLLDEPALACLERYGVDIESWEGDLTVHARTDEYEEDDEDDRILVRPEATTGLLALGVPGGLDGLRQALVDRGFPDDKDLSPQFNFEAEFTCLSQAGIERMVTASAIKGWILRCPVV